MGKMEDKWKKDELVIVIGFVILSLGTLGYLFISSPMELFVLQAVIGFGWAFGTPALDTLYSKSLEKGKTNMQWGFWEASNRIVEALSAFFGGIIVVAFGFKALFITMFILSLLSVIIVSKIIWTKGHKKSLWYWHGKLHKRRHKRRL